MTGQERSALRLLAYLMGRSLPIRGTRALAPDGSSAVGLVAIAHSGSDHIRALAVGPVDGVPTLATGSLDDPDDPVAGRCDRLLRDALAHPDGGRLWVADRRTVALLALDGRRHAASSRVGAERRSLAGCFAALADVAALPGQQVVAVAVALLAAHRLTGDGPWVERHLAARLAWDDPAPSTRPADAAAVLELDPGPTLLAASDENRIDDLIVQLRDGAAGAAGRPEVDRLLRARLEELWALLLRARRVFAAQALPPLPGLGALAAASRNELGFALGRDRRYGRDAHDEVEEFRRRVAWHGRVVDLDARGDPIVREALRRQGRVLALALLRKRSLGRGKGWSLLLRTDQETLRARVGTRLQTEDGAVVGVVEGVRHQPGGALLLLRVDRGAREIPRLAVGAVADWFDTVPFPFRPGKRPNHTVPAMPAARPLAPLACEPDPLADVLRRRRP